MSQRGVTMFSTCCRRSLIKNVQPETKRRTLSTITTTTTYPERLQVPVDLPEAYYSQLPKRLRPDQEKREIVIHPSPPSEREACKDTIKFIDEQQRKILDPTGARSRLFDPKNPDGAKAGDILLATFKSGEPFSGIAMSIKFRGPHTSVLLRNHLTRVGTEMDVKVFSPLVQSVEIAQKATKRPRRARLFYLRQPKHDVGSVQKVVDQYLKKKAILTGGKPKGGKQGGMGRKGPPAR